MAQYKVGITVGVFDLFHVGHLNLLERCKRMCDHLIVAVCQDDYVTQIKKKTPVYPAADRMRILAALKCVDEVIPVSIAETEDKMLLIKNHPFDVLFSGDDWKGTPRYLKTEEQFKEYGAKIEYLSYTQGVSTTQTKAKLKRPLDHEAAVSLEGTPAEQFKKLVARYGGYWRYEGLKDYYYLVNPYFPTAKLREEIKSEFDKLVECYPSGQRVNANLAARVFGVGLEQILVGNGAAELIQAFMSCTTGKTGFVFPTFEEYANRYPEDLREIFHTSPDNGFRYRAKDVISHFEIHTVSTLILLNPDMPTGNFLPFEDIEEITGWTRKRGVRLLIDESFVDFADTAYTCITPVYLKSNPHVGVVKSISKSYGVPGFRLGVFASGDEELIARMKKSVSIWNVNSFGEYFLQIIGRYRADYRDGCRRIAEERNRFAEQLKAIPFLKTFPSGANFILAEVLPPYRSDELSAMLWEKRRILFRDCSKKNGFGGRSFVRIAVRNKEDNDILLEVLRELV